MLPLSLLDLFHPTEEFPRSNVLLHLTKGEVLFPLGHPLHTMVLAVCYHLAHLHLIMVESVLLALSLPSRVYTLQVISWLANLSLGLGLVSHACPLLRLLAHTVTLELLLRLVMLLVALALASSLVSLRVLAMECRLIFLVRVWMIPVRSLLQKGSHVHPTLHNHTHHSIP